MNAATAAADLAASLAAAVDTLLVARPDVLALVSEAQRAARLQEDIDRTQLVVGIVGGTGVGKSTLINALAGATISRTGERRPTTDRIVCHRHRDAPMPEGLAAGDLSEGTPTHDEEALRHVVLLDLPDVDGRVASHPERVARVLPRLDALVVMTSVDKYADRALYDLLRVLPQARPGLLFVLNAVDRLCPADRDRVLADFRAMLATYGGLSDPAPLALSARDALSPDGRTRGASGLPALRAGIEALGTDAVRRRILVDNARAARERVRVSIEAVLPAAETDAWLTRLETIPTRAPAPTPGAVAAFGEALEREIAPALSRRARRASGFPIFELDALTRWLRPRGAEPTTGEAPAAAIAFRERWLDQPLAIAAQEATLLARPVDDLPFQPLVVPRTGLGVPDATSERGGAQRGVFDAATASASPDGDACDVAFTRWNAGLGARSAACAWRFRQHVLPLTLAFGALMTAAGPFLAHAIDPAASGAAGSPSPMVFFDRLGALRWDLLLGVAAAWYAIVPLRFARRVARACEREAQAGATALATGLGARFEASFGAAWRAEVSRRRDFVTAVRRAAAQLARSG